MARALEPISFLVVDDNHHMRRLIHLILGSAGARSIREARDGREALAELRRGLPDILITDWMMSPMDGVELCRYIRQADGSPQRHLPIILMAGMAEARLVPVAVDAGATAVVMKPLWAGSLLGSIRDLLALPPWPEPADGSRKMIKRLAS